MLDVLPGRLSIILHSLGRTSGCSAFFPERADKKRGGLMQKSISIATGAAAAAIFTHGMVFSAMDLSERLPISTYRGFFQHILFATEGMWSYAHGWQPMSHIRDFGHFYAPIIHLICPLIGFTLFWILSRHRVGVNVWKPLAISLLMTIPPTISDLTSGYVIPLVEAARTVIIVLLMVWSVGAVRISKPRTWATKSLATA
jgi:hypothetical protein